MAACRKLSLLALLAMGCNAIDATGPDGAPTPGGMPGAVMPPGPGAAQDADTNSGQDDATTASPDTSACVADSDCPFDTCFQGRCVGVGEEGGHCDINCGVPRGTKPPPWSCHDCLACVDARCRRCDADDQCWPYVCNLGLGVCEQLELPPDAGLDEPVPCTTDDDCGPLPDNPAWERFCDLGFCTPLGYDPPSGHGSPCPHPTAQCTPADCCFPFACVDGRCRSCTQDAECGPAGTCTEGRCH